MPSNTRARAEQRFRDRVAELGGTVIEPIWLGTRNRHRIVCEVGHEWAVRPGAVSQGIGICGICAGNDPLTAERQFREMVRQQGGQVIEPVWLGATRRHRVTCSVTRVLLPGLLGTTAPEIETAVLATLRLAGEVPLHGREYFNDSALALVLDVVTNTPDLAHAMPVEAISRYGPAATLGGPSSPMGYAHP
jgi:hypothetical protein